MLSGPGVLPYVSPKHGAQGAGPLELDVCGVGECAGCAVPSLDPSAPSASARTAMYQARHRQPSHCMNQHAKRAQALLASLHVTRCRHRRRSSAIDRNGRWPRVETRRRRLGGSGGRYLGTRTRTCRVGVVRRPVLSDDKWAPIWAR
ncbi:hypothetical protein BU26DRAFT_520984 [Trematosphaeria pertusa]|uniref:Uncharacterized protein n=1 Tax=Trematosphaeria pertusa TaxID=390896 RepID=A0A6A6I7I8_9PLEO|nr:uncharacterized protein BU26DRAFT_520984 [Trematosphaeria pertusa]KAF2246524.1 hypothetical protein BU26DRAFT_520984 [Trematosphaeria pertusa]